MVAESIKDKPLSKRKPRPLKPRNRKGSKTPTILALATTTYATPTQIASKVNVSKRAVYDTLKRYSIEPNTLESFKNTRAEILTGFQEKIISNFTPDKLKDASINNLAYALQQLNTIERLERGQSTANIQANQITGSLKDLIELITGKAEAVDITPNNDK
jgi:predicted DNA-binding protein YlxM (UPF0122 family)